MSGTELQFAWLSDARLAAHALSPMPVWLWSADATRILWANPTAAAIFDAASPGALAPLQFDPQHASAAQIVRLAGTLPQGGAPRLERLRGFGASFGGTLICLCSRIALDDNSAGILVVSTERSAKDLSLPERARRMLADFERPAAIFTADGELIDATPSARARFGKQSRPDRARRRKARARGQPQRQGRRRHRRRTDHHAAARRRRDRHAAHCLRGRSQLIACRRARERGRRRDRGIERAQPRCAGAARTPAAVPFRLADGCGHPLHARRCRSSPS